MRFWTGLLSLALLFGQSPAAAQTATPLPPMPPSVEDVPIALLVDMSTGQTLFARNIERRFMPASITKMMTTFVAFELMEQGRLFPRQSFSVRPETFRKWNRVGSTMFLPHDARVTADDLLHGITTVSANDASVVLAEGAVGSVEAFTALMNEKARELGMRDSHFANPNGWMDEGRTFVTARDLAILAEAMVTRHPGKFAHFVGQTQFRYNDITQNNHDPLTGTFPGADGIKTGFTNEAGYGYVGTAERNGNRLIMVVAGVDRGSIRNRAARSFMEWGFANFERRLLFSPGETLAVARVQDGDTRTIELTTRRPIRVDIPRGTRPDIRLAVHYDGPVRAPFTEGQPIAELEISVDGMATARVPLVAAVAVEEANALERVVNGMIGWFA